MRETAFRGLGLIVGLAVAMPLGSAADPKDGEKEKSSLVGTWKLVSAKYGGKEHKFDEGTTTVKHVTPAQFMWASYDKDGKVTRAAGGAYTLKDGKYEETPEYGMSGDFDAIKGKAHTFTCKLDGDKWYHEGKLANDLTIEEVWERVKAK